MYKYVKKLAATALPLCLAVLLSACGGAPTDEPSNNPSSVINKPQVSSAEASSAPSPATPSSASSSVATSTTSANASSIALSSTDSYARVSRASSSAGNSSSSLANNIDAIPPSSTKLMLYQLAENSLRLTWDIATDNVGVSHYEIERNGQLIAVLEHPTKILSDHQLLAYTDYHYTITAFDAVGNRSEKSPVFTVRTLANANSSRSNSSKLSTSSVNSSAASTYKTITLSWNHPTKRENGAFLELDEIGGYELRFKTGTTVQYTHLTLNGNTTTTYTTELIPNNSDIQIAVFDTTGLYSDFVDISPEN